MITVAEHLDQILEAALFAASEPLTVDRLGQLFGEGERPDNATIKEAVEALQTRYEGGALELAKVASGYRFQARVEFAPWLQRLWEKKPPRYTRALLETLSLIVYRQPVTRGEIEDVRGVAVSSNIIKTLMERDWIRVVGHRDVPGKPALFGTTKTFLDYFNLKTLAQLPPLRDIVDMDELAERFADQGEMLLEINEAIEARAAAEAVKEAAEAAGHHEDSDTPPDPNDDESTDDDLPEAAVKEEDAHEETSESVYDEYASEDASAISDEVSKMVDQAQEVANVVDAIIHTTTGDASMLHDDASLEEDEPTQ